ncbi:MAG TPA: thioesterase domain-containing protein, partial [Casimicrobiaceae bacterium]|nr:thioesterase domain-containing protein [Casimicrobiaceae bacterium]
GAHLREFLRGRLLAAAMPREVIELPTLPRNARGKVERKALTQPPRPIEAPRRELERTLMQIFADLLGRHRIGPTDDFFDCGGDSLLGVRLVGEIEALTGLPFRLDQLAVAATPRAIAGALDQNWSAWATQNCITINASGHAAPLFGICGAWGHAVRLLRLGRAVGADVPFHAMQPPQMRWPPGIDLRAMAAHYAAQIRTLAPHGPCRLIGTSFGGIMAFEVALQLQAQGYPVALLCAVDSPPPGSTLKPPPALRPGAGAIEQAGLEVYLAHVTAANGYAPDRQFAGGMLYFRCAGARRSVVREWARRVRDPLEIVPVPGVHGKFHVEPQLSAIAHTLRAALAGSAPRVAAPITAHWSYTHPDPALGAGRGDVVS